MGRSCCVPGCKSNYQATDTSAFRFPKDKLLRQKWIRFIHRKDFVVTNNSLVCIKHFEEKFVIKEDVFPVLNGEPIIVPRKIPKLRDDAYPSIFPNQPSYHTIKVPKERKDPCSRSELVLSRDEENFKKWCEKDVISDFVFFKSEVMKRNISPFISVVKKDYILFMKVNDEASSDIPYITVSFKVTSDLNVKVFYRNLYVPPENFKWILESEGQEGLVCDRWTKFDNLLSHLQNYSNETFGVNERVVFLTNFLKEALDSDGFDVEKDIKIKFLVEQLQLCLMKQLKYSTEMLIWAATFCYSFPGAYQAMRETNVLTLPHPVYLKQFLGKIGPIMPGIGPSHKAFLKEKSKLLQSEDRIISIMLDEIYLSSKVTYKGGKILGMAENSTSDVASTMQVFMSSSLHSKSKDVIGLFPVKNMQADTLHKLTIEVLTVMHDLGFHVVCLVSDNNRVNRKMFECLCGGNLKPCIPNPANPSTPIFLLFDTVHLLKCIRNNWLSRTFNIPNVEEVFSVFNAILNSEEGTIAVCEYTVVEAKFTDLRDLFHTERNMLLKLAPALSRKALYPSSIERQNVKLALSIFDCKNIVALETLKNQNIEISDGTIQFLRLFSKWWAICNVKHPMKGKYTRNNDATPISGTDDSKLVFLQNLKNYLDIWHSSSVQGKLSNDTYVAIKHTLDSMVELCKYIFNTYNWKYILTAKLQTDGLEGRFGAYRRLSGCSYNVSVEQVLESERKLKVLSMLKLKSAKFGEVSLNDFAVTVQKSCKEPLADDLQYLESAINEMEFVSISPETQKILVCIASYTCNKVIENLNGLKDCNNCQLMLHNNEEIELVCDKELLSYFYELNRGGLKCPSPFMMTVSSNVYALFQTLISNAYEIEFLKLNNQRNAVVKLGVYICELGINNLDDFCSCGLSLRVIVKKCVKVLSNIFINNYTKVLNEKKNSKELAKTLERKRKDDHGHGSEEKVRQRKQLKFQK